jgi:DNA invertase Pin-like site-specific DNA recombinase
MASNKIKAIAYLRTSSAANVGTDKDSDKRQRAAITAFAKTRGYEIVEEFYDAAVSGADPINERPGFKAMLDRIAGNGVRVCGACQARHALSRLAGRVGHAACRCCHSTWNRNDSTYRARCIEHTG